MRMYDELIGLHNPTDMMKMRGMAIAGDRRMDEMEARIKSMEDMMKGMHAEHHEDEEEM